MKVLCKHHKTCRDRVNCYHSNPHNLTSGWAGLNFIYNCKMKDSWRLRVDQNCKLYDKDCECGEKLKKINYETI